MLEMAAKLSAKKKTLVCTGMCTALLVMWGERPIDCSISAPALIH